MNQSGHALILGDLFSERTHWDPNSFELRYKDGSFLLQLNFPSPSPAELHSFHTGAINLALHFEQNVIFFCFRIEGCMDHSDQAFSIRLLAEEDQGIPPPDNFYRTLPIVVVDSNTGIIVGLRMVTMSPRFWGVFRNKLTIQKEMPFSRDIHFSTIDKLYQKYPTSKHVYRASLIQEKAGVTIK